MIKDYESMVILKPHLHQDEVEKVNEKLIAQITDIGGEYIKSDFWGKRQLAYPIDKTGDGYYIINYFRLESLQMKTIERSYNINENILRYIVVDRHENRR